MRASRIVLLLFLVVAFSTMRRHILMTTVALADECPDCTSKLDCTELETVVVAWGKNQVTGAFVWKGKSYYERNDNGTPSVAIVNACINFYTTCSDYDALQAPSITNDTQIMIFESVGTPYCVPDPSAKQGINVEGSVSGPLPGVMPNAKMGQALCSRAGG